MLVWLTDWQLAEDHLLVTRDDVVDWTLYPADRDWLTRLFGHAPAEWQVDTYGDAVDQPSRRVRGRVDDLRSVRCRQLATEEGIVPVRGQATLRPVHDTSASWTRAHRDDASGALYGYLASVVDAADAGEARARRAG